MKLFMKSAVTIAAFAVLSLFASGCASASAVSHPDYASMSPEDSCIIILGFPGNKQVTFKQINPELEVDEQTFKYGLFDFCGITIFKPCRPGSRWMLTKIKGEQLENAISGSKIKWDFDMNPNQQFVVIDVPQKPGIYVYADKFFDAQHAVYSCSSGTVMEIPSPDKGDYAKKVYKKAEKDFLKMYAGTLWEKAFKEKKAFVCGENN